jgi:hypothetical protein
LGAALHAGYMIDCEKCGSHVWKDGPATACLKDVEPLDVGATPKKSGCDLISESNENIVLRVVIDPSINGGV